MPAQTHAAVAPVPVPVLVHGDDSPTPLPLHPHLHTPSSGSGSGSPSHAPHSIKHLTGEVLATAHLLQQQIRTLECLAHATEEREATLVQQRAKLQELLHLVTQMETAEVRATASLRDTLARVRAGRDRGAAAFAALHFAGGASPAASPSPGAGAGAGSPAPLARPGGGGGGEGEADPAGSPSPESVGASGGPRKGSGAEGCEGDRAGGEQHEGQSGEGEGVDGASKHKQAGSGPPGGVGDGDGEAEGKDASQPFPQFSSLRVKTEGEEPQRAQMRGAPQEEDVGTPLPQANPVASPGTGTPEPRVEDRNHSGEDGSARAQSEHDAEIGQVDGVKEPQATATGDGRGVSVSGTAACRQLDLRPTSALGGATGPQPGSPASSRQGDEPTDVHKAATGSDGSWRVRKRMPGRNAKEQMKGVAEAEARQEGPKGRGEQGESNGQAGSLQQKQGGQRTPSPKKAPVPGDRVQPSPPKKAGKGKGGVARRN